MYYECSLVLHSIHNVYGHTLNITNTRSRKQNKFSELTNYVTIHLENFYYTDYKTGGVCGVVQLFTRNVDRIYLSLARWDRPGLV